MTAARAHALVIFGALLGLFEGPAEIACAIALVLTAASGGLRGLRPNLADLGLLVWLAAGLVGAASGEVRWGSEPNLRPLLALAYVLGRTAIAEAEPRVLARLGLAFALGTAVNALYGVVQVALVDPGLERWIVGRARAAHLATGDGRLKMATGLFYNRMKLVHVGVVALGATLLMAASSSRRRALGAIALAITLGVLLTYRRAAPLALLASLGALALLVGRARVLAAIGAAGALLVGVAALLGRGRERLEAAGDDLGERVEIWLAARDLIGAHPLIGVGHGGYGRAIAPYLEGASSADLVKNALTNPHNALLYVLAETGLVGFLGFAVATAASLAAVVHAVRRDRASDAPRAVLDRVALVSLTTLLAIGVVHAVLYHAPVALIFWAMLGVASSRIGED